MIKKCRFGHDCTSGCQKDFDCPCQADHCCAMTQNCEGCDDHYEVESPMDELKRLIQESKRQREEYYEKLSMQIANLQDLFKK